MTVRRSDNGTVILEGACAVEDAEPLLQMLQATPTPAVDWTTMQPPPYGCGAGHIGLGQRPDRSLRR